MRLGWVVTLLATVGACSSDAASGAAGAGDATARQAPRSRVAFELVLGDGTVWAEATPKGDGYALSAGGADRGKLKIEADRVKVSDASGATRAKAKAKDYGFKIYEGDETEVATAKRKGAGYKLSRNDTPLGELDTHGPGGQLGGEEITVVVGAERMVVKRAGKDVGAVGGGIRPEAAAFLGVTELTFEQRVAGMLFVEELAR
ncbi:MAG: hypothetical protein IT373_25725 [Polyangiaceae bacterium]|nr:hypothetical protein [Polyangiaceae bacterium]